MDGFFSEGDENGIYRNVSMLMMRFPAVEGIQRRDRVGHASSYIICCGVFVWISTKRQGKKKGR
jgi:hypothetical protein